MVIEIKRTSEAVIWRGLLKQIKVTSFACKRETVIVYW